MGASSNGLMTVEKARQFLAQCRDVDEIRDLRDKAEAIARYQRSRAAAEDSGISAAVIARRAERRLGELVAELPKAPAGRPAKNRSHAATNSTKPTAPTLADHGITKSESSRWQAIAKVPEKKFEATIAEAIEAKKPPTAAALVRLVRKPKAEPKPPPKFDVEASARQLRSMCDDHMYKVPLDANLEPFISTLRGLVSKLEKMQEGRTVSDG